MTAAVASRPSAGSSSRYAALGLLARLALRRSRIYYGVWVLALVATLAATVAAYERVVPPGASAELTKVMEAQTAEAQKKFATLLETASQNAPAGSESAVNAMKNAVSAASTPPNENKPGCE